jgi:hypothetical protein
LKIGKGEFLLRQLEWGQKIKKLTNGQKIALLKSGGQHTGDFINNK